MGSYDRYPNHQRLTTKFKRSITKGFKIRELIWKYTQFWILFDRTFAQIKVKKMQVKTLLGATFLALSLASCSTVEKVVYRIDVPQGNYLEATTVAQVKEGMTAQQVQYLLGTPVLVDPYNSQTWYYVFLQQRAYETPVQHTFTVKFDQRGIVTETHLDKPLPQVSQQGENNTIIETGEKPKSSWWKFWK
ncbi:small protein A, putative [Haemophilus influenzae Rd KW20]|nr:small protein A, putative [Haemophilus influenzae Rd KW20]